MGDRWLRDRTVQMVSLRRWLERWAKDLTDEDEGAIEIELNEDRTVLTFTINGRYMDVEGEIRTWGVGQIYDVELTITDVEHEIGNDSPWDHYFDFCDGCEYNGPDGCEYKDGEGCVYLDELHKKLDELNDKVLLELGKLKITAGWDARKCYLNVPHDHYYPTVTIEARDLLRHELKAILMLTHVWADLAEGLAE